MFSRLGAYIRTLKKVFDLSLASKFFFSWEVPESCRFSGTL